MIAPLALALFALLASTAGARWLRQADWPDRAPGLGVLAWQALSLSVVVSVILAGAALAVPTMPASTDLAEFLHMCALALQAQYATPGGAALSLTGAVLAVAITARVGCCVVASLRCARRQRVAQQRSVQLVARRHPVHDVLVVDYAAAAVYCVPGRGRAVVMTSAALEALDEEQTAAVLAHERAHLRSRHDLVLAVAAGLRWAFPGVSVFATAQRELCRLVEMHADDVATRGACREALATAVFRLAGGAAPVGALGAGTRSVVARVRRLIDDPHPLGWPAAVLAGSAVVLTVLAPLLIVAAPAIVAAAADLCPLDFPTA